MSCIYAVINQLNGKTYIGKTTQQPHTRWKQHRDAAIVNTKGSPHLYAAINKYGIEKFYFEVLCSVPDEELDDAERFLIYILGTRAFGYNLREGGDGGKHSNISREKMSKRRKGKPSHRLGKHLSPEHAAAAKAAQNTPEFHEKASALAKSRNINIRCNTPEAGAKRSAANSRRVWSIESRAKLRAARLGKSPANKGIPRTPETRALLCAAWVRRKQHAGII